MTTQTAGGYTQGQWKVGETLDKGLHHDKFFVHTDKENMKIALIPFDETRTKEVARANARLIAAAPDMLEALEYDIEYWEQSMRDGIKFDNEGIRTYNKLKAAIAKAKGEEIVTPEQAAHNLKNEDNEAKGIY